MKLCNYLFSPIILLLLCVHISAKTADNDLELIRKKYIYSLIHFNDVSNPLTQLLKEIPPENKISDQVIFELHQHYPFNLDKIKIYVEAINEDGSWPDINYSDNKHSGWDAIQHANRIFELTKLYYTEGTSSEKAAQYSTVIHQALDYWFRTKPVCKNWWYNKIGIPKTLGSAFLLLHSELTPAEQEKAVKVMDIVHFGMTGQNKVWLAGNILLKGLLLNDYNLVKAARDTIVSEITIGQKEGIKSDWSFHQHGAQQQFGNYGLAYLSEMSFFSGLFAETSLALDIRQQSILNKLVLDGYRWIVWKNNLDVNALDRQLFHNVSVHKALMVGYAANQLKQGSNPVDQKKIRVFLEDNFLSPPREGSSFVGQKHFWDSDQTVHRTPTWMASIKMASERVIGTELVNEDNLNGFYMGDGATYIYQKGDEYLNIFPLWDWRKIPGITSYESEAAIPRRKALNQSSFVGGVTDGQTGMTTMVFNRDGIKAHKSWVLTKNFVLCLGAGIQSDSTLSLATSIDQRVKRGSLSYYKDQVWTPVNGTIQSMEKQARFFHDNTGYIVLQPDNCVAISEKRSGDWSEFMGSYAPTISEGEVVSLYIRHKKEQSPLTYQYMILPSVTQAKTASFDTGAINILQNDKKVQAIGVGGCFYVVSYEPSELRLKADLLVEFRTPGIYIFDVKKKYIRITGVDPIHTQSTLSLRINDSELKMEPSSKQEPGESFSVDYKFGNQK